MPRKVSARRILPLPKKPLFRKGENKTELVLALLRDVARLSQRAEAQLFYSVRQVGRRFGIPTSLAAKAYRQLEREGLLKPIRGSGTMLEGLEAIHQSAARGVVAIASSLSQFITRQDYRVFRMRMDRELQKRGFVATEAFFEAGETADRLADRLKECHPDQVIWHSPRKLSREVALRMHDFGVQIIGVADTGFPSIHCQYEVRRQLALAEIVGQWKTKGAIPRVKVALGPGRSAADEARIGRTLEEMNIEVQFVSFGSQTVKGFTDSLARNPTVGTVLSHSAASLLAMYSPEAFARLARSFRLAFVGGPVSMPYAKFTDANVDLVIVDWKAVAKRIVDDLLKRRILSLEEPCVFEATAQFGVPLSLYSQRL